MPRWARLVCSALRNLGSWAKRGRHKQSSKENILVWLSMCKFPIMGNANEWCTATLTDHDFLPSSKGDLIFKSDQQLDMAWGMPPEQLSLDRAGGSLPFEPAAEGYKDFQMHAQAMLAGTRNMTVKEEDDAELAASTYSSMAHFAIEPSPLNLPLVKYGGAWTKSCIQDEDLQEALLLHLQSLGKYVAASAVVTYLDCPEVQNTFIPAWYEIDANTRRWSSTNPLQCEDEEMGTAWKTVVWCHDESTFYAHDCCKAHWVSKDAKALPQQKGEGLSLMVADFVLAHYGWLHSHDGKEAARVLFRVGKGQDGYFTNDEILKQVKKAMTILEKDYLDDNHVFIFDNATTHLKQINMKDIEGKLVYGADGKPKKKKDPYEGWDICRWVTTGVLLPTGSHNGRVFQGDGHHS
ncbi:hypothetical protein F5J12DRAFT_786353 [Pisolithus orientalis]|uniref:uncharacterized protein n=1 Tax=Pisolithus orientalis TaxID=936130 RepID=UPI002224F545|nr:uncharacterized protein F5J12DRAFT_786353 [Pisolithus orientalis]KAI5991275.1 hypothetical protein F5J12DRAFT_786353 [Pisolithus orientalis]